MSRKIEFHRSRGKFSPSKTSFFFVTNLKMAQMTVNRGWRGYDKKVEVDVLEQIGYTRKSLSAFCLQITAHSSRQTLFLYFFIIANIVAVFFSSHFPFSPRNLKSHQH